jgi:methionine sulfoxide reductase heme-binding subunit
MEADARPLRPSAARARLVTLVAWSLGLYPVVALAYAAATGGLGTNPIELLTHRTGWWALALLLASLAVTPLRRLTGVNELIRARRPLGLFAFLLATLHLLVYFVLDQELGFEYLVEDVLERPFITVGFTAWLLLVPLALTSTRGWIRRLGKRWRRLHTLVYAAAALGVLHFAWGVKADLREPAIFAALLALLLGARLLTRGRSGGGSGGERARRSDGSRRAPAGRA